MGLTIVKPKPPVWREHFRLMAAGWRYRVNDARNWIVYRDPATGLWHVRKDAIRILDGGGGSPGDPPVPEAA